MLFTNSVQASGSILECAQPRCRASRSMTRSELTRAGHWDDAATPLTCMVTGMMRLPCTNGCRLSRTLITTFNFLSTLRCHLPGALAPGSSPKAAVFPSRTAVTISRSTLPTPTAWPPGRDPTTPSFLGSPRGQSLLTWLGQGEAMSARTTACQLAICSARSE